MTRNVSQLIKTPPDAMRSGVAATELAVCLPVLLVVVIGTIECCTMIFLKQSLATAAYEGIRVAVGHDTVTTDVVTRANQILAERRVSGGTVTMSPSNVSAVPVGQYITVTVAAPANSNSVLQGWFFNNMTIRAQATMMKEF